MKPIYQKSEIADYSLVTGDKLVLTTDFKRNIKKIPALSHVSDIFNLYAKCFIENALQYDSSFSLTFTDMFRNADNAFQDKNIKEEMKKIIAKNIEKIFFCDEEGNLNDRRDGTILSSDGELIETKDKEEELKSLIYDDCNLEKRVIAKIVQEMMSTVKKGMILDKEKLRESMSFAIQNLGLKQPYSSEEECRVEERYKNLKLKMNSSGNFPTLTESINNIAEILSKSEINIWSIYLDLFIYISFEPSLISPHALMEKKSLCIEDLSRSLRSMNEEVISQKELEEIEYYCMKESLIESIGHRIATIATLTKMDEYPETYKLQGKESCEMLPNLKEMLFEVCEESEAYFHNHIKNIANDFLIKTHLFNSEEIVYITGILNDKSWCSIREELFELVVIKKNNKHVILTNAENISILKSSEEDKLLVKKYLEVSSDPEALLKLKYQSMKKKNEDFISYDELYDFVEKIIWPLLKKDAVFYFSPIIKKWNKDPEKIINIFKSMNKSIFQASRPEKAIENIVSYKDFTFKIKEKVLVKNIRELFYELLPLLKGEELITLYCSFTPGLSFLSSRFSFSLLIANSENKKEMVDFLLQNNIHPVNYEKDPKRSDLSFMLNSPVCTLQDIDLLFEVFEKIGEKELKNNLLCTFSEMSSDFTYSLSFLPENEIMGVLDKMIYVKKKYGVEFIGEENINADITEIECKKSIFELLKKYPKTVDKLKELGLKESDYHNYLEEDKIFKAFESLHYEEMFYYFHNERINLNMPLYYHKKDSLMDIIFERNSQYYRLSQDQWLTLFKENLTTETIEKSTEKKEEFYSASNKKRYSNIYTKLLISNSHQSIFDKVIRYIIIELGYECPFSEEEMEGRISVLTQRKVTNWKIEREKNYLLNSNIVSGSSKKETRL